MRNQLLTYCHMISFVKVTNVIEYLMQRKGPFIKNVRTKSRNCPPLTLSRRTHHKFRKIRSFCTKKCRRLHLKNFPSPLSALDKPPPSIRLRTSFMDSPFVGDSSKIRRRFSHTCRFGLLNV